MSEIRARVFKTKAFARFTDRENIGDNGLCEAAARILAGRADVDLGGGVLKQRVARRGQGKSGGFRVIVLFRRGSSVFFVYGFAKNERDNIGPDELKAFRKLADQMLALDEGRLSAALKSRTLREIECHG